MKIKVYLLMIVCMFIGISGAYAEATHVESEGTIQGLQQVITEFAEDGLFSNPGAARALTVHLTAVGVFEQMGKREKVIQHMEGFHRLLNHQKEKEWISQQTYETIQMHADAIITRWNSLAIVQNGEANAVVMIAQDADPQIQKIAEVLVEYVQKSTGAELTIVNKDEATDGQVRIYIDGDINRDELDEMNDQGFIIEPDLDHSTLTIAGPTIWGTVNGVYEFLERYVGVRWLVTGPSGEDVPLAADIVVPNERVKEEPAFQFRVLSPLSGNPENPGARQHLNEWAQRNKLQGSYNWTVRFHHNIYSLFPVEKYGQTNPEFYPGGKPPAPGVQTGWQPCFSAEGLVDVAVAEIIDYFDENPDVSSFSLGVNDSGGYCETNPNHPAYPDKINSIGIVDMSDLYYEWVNEVVEQVLAVHPDKWFGLLAYQNVMDPPSFDLHPRVVPFVTKDRMTWIDEEIRQDNHQQMEDWNEVASQVAWYDYMYGTFYVLPRVYPHLMAESYQYSEQKGVFGHYAEIYHNIGDGPKAWLSAKLQWDPYADVDALLDEWYERMVGPEAASDLRAYYELWEEFWTERIKESAWFDRGKNRTYLPFTDYSYLSLVSNADLSDSKQLLEAVLEKTQTEAQYERAQMLWRMFEYYEASALSFARESDPPANAQEAIEMVERVANGTYMAQKRHDLIEEFESEPALQFPILPRVDWSGLNPYEFWHIVDYVTEQESTGGPVSDYINGLSSQQESSELRDVARLLKQALQGADVSLLTNTSFEEGNSQAPPWSFWVKETGSIERVEGIAHTGDASLQVDQMVRGGPAQFFEVQPGLLAARVYYYTPEGTETEGTMQLIFNVQNAQGQNLMVITKELKRLTETAGAWASTELLEMIPATVNGQTVSRIQAVLTVDSAEDVTVYLDDAVAYQITEEDYPPVFEAAAIKTTASKEEILQTLDFSEGPWTEAEMMNDYLIMNSSDQPTVETRTYLLWDDENLYVGYENFDHDIAGITASDNAPGSWWGDGANDSVETYLTKDAEDSFKGFFTNPKGVKFVRQKDPDSPQGPVSGIEWETNAVILDDRWNVIQVIPFAEIDVDPTETNTLVGLFFRDYHAHEEYIGWGGGAPWVPGDFKPIHLVEKD